MVVGPEEIIEKIKENEDRIIKEIEKRIDERLVEAKKGSDTAVRKFTVGIGDLNTNDLIKRVIKEKYLEAGWRTVIFRTEQDKNEYEIFIDLEA